MSDYQLVINLAVALLLGALIGIERQWRAREAGLRTTALVAAGSALFVLLSKYGFVDLGHVRSQTYDGSRVAAQIVSGIGFLGAGVIMRGGRRVHGINTAATLWCSAAIGALSGAGMFLLAVAGTAAVLLTHVMLRPVARRLDRSPTAGDELPGAYRLWACCQEADAPHVRRLLIQLLDRTDFVLRTVRTDPDESHGQATPTGRWWPRS